MSKLDTRKLILDTGKLIPRIWADTLAASLEQRLTLYDEWLKQQQAQQEHRMATDPEYARAYELRRAQDEAWSYWDALYENQLPESEDEEDW